MLVLRSFSVKILGLINANVCETVRANIVSILCDDLCKYLHNLNPKVSSSTTFFGAIYANICVISVACIIKIF